MTLKLDLPDRLLAKLNAEADRGASRPKPWRSACSTII